MNVVITGSTRGIGLGLAKEFLRSGHNILINGRNRETTTEVLIELRMEFPDSIIHSYACDMTNINSIKRMCWEAYRFYGNIDIWINNVGTEQQNKLIHEHEIEAIDKVIDVNLKSAIYATRIVSEQMLEKGGFIYNMEGYGSNDMMTDKMSYYGTAKRALTYFTKSAAKEMKNTKVKICLLSPGMVITDLLLSSLPESGPQRVKLIKMFNILADKVEPVTKFLVKKMEKNMNNGKSIKWLTNGKALLRFLSSPFSNRKIVDI